MACIDCGRLCRAEPASRRGRCSGCASVRERSRNRRRTHYQGGYRAAAIALVSAANADAATVCAECGGLLSAVDADGVWLGKWTAGHQSEDSLAAEHRFCNESKGRTY